MVEEARGIAKWADNIVFKIPMTEDVLKVINTLSKEGIRTNKHLGESALAGAHIYTIPGTLFEKMWTHPITTQGIESFKRDWDSFIEKSK